MLAPRSLLALGLLAAAMSACKVAPEQTVEPADVDDPTLTAELERAALGGTWVAELRRSRVIWAVVLAAIAWMWPLASWAQSPSSEGPRPADAAQLDVRALWSDGDELLIGGGRRSIVLFDDAGEPAAVDATDIELFVDADGTRAAGGLLAVFAAADGRVVLWRYGSRTSDQVPLLEGDELVAVVVDASGTVFAIGKELALYERGTQRWRVYPYPTRMRPLAAEATPGGQVYIVGRDGLLVRFLDGEWDRPLVPGLTPESIRAPWYDCWYSAASGSLWVRVGRDRLIELEFASQRAVSEAEAEPAPLLSQTGEEPSEAKPGEKQPQTPGPTLRISGTVPTREHPIPIGVPQEGEPPAGFTALTGVSSAAGDRVVMTAGGRVWMWDRGRFVLVGQDIGLVHDLSLDEGQGVAWVATRDGLVRVPLVAISDEQADQPLAQSDQRLLDRLQRREAWQLRNADLPRFFWMPTIRVDNGVVFPLGADPVAGYSLEIGAGAMLQPLVRDRGPTLWVWPELAYRFETHPTRGGHLFDLGVGVGFGTHLVGAFYRPRLVLGGIDRPTKDGPAVYGLRHGVALETLWGVLGLEVSHQYLGSNEGALNDIRVGLSINLAPLIWIGILWATIPTGDS